VHRAPPVEKTVSAPESIVVRGVGLSLPDILTLITTPPIMGICVSDCAISPRGGTPKVQDMCLKSSFYVVRAE
jgi:hypothetical protein